MARLLAGGTVEPGAYVLADGVVAEVTDGTWEVTVPIAVGMHVIEVVARDDSGNESRASVVVERLESADASLAEFIAARGRAWCALLLFANKLLADMARRAPSHAGPHQDREQVGGSADHRIGAQCKER